MKANRRENIEEASSIIVDNKYSDNVYSCICVKPAVGYDLGDITRFMDYNRTSDVAVVGIFCDFVEGI